MPYGIRALFEPIRSRAAGDIDAGYQAIGTALTQPIRILVVNNLTDESLLFSTNGTDDHFVLPANGFLLLDISSDNTPEQAFFISKGTIFYVKQLGVATTGSVYVTAVYGFGDQ